jgi:hypothetical protein
MKFRLLIPVIMVLVATIFAAGCSGGGQTTPAPTAPPTPVPTIAVSTTALPTSAGGSTRPGPTQTIPVGEAVSISVEKAGTYSTTIIAHFDGGKGMSFVSRIDVTVTRPDGTSETKPLKPLKGEVTEIEGTNGTDRVEILVSMMSGSQYKVIDQQMPYKRRG